jgi:hypothetical protein
MMQTTLQEEDLAESYAEERVPVETVLDDASRPERKQS